MIDFIIAAMYCIVVFGVAASQYVLTKCDVNSKIMDKFITDQFSYVYSAETDAMDGRLKIAGKYIDNLSNVLWGK